MHQIVMAITVCAWVSRWRTYPDSRDARRAIACAFGRRALGVSIIHFPRCFLNYIHPIPTASRQEADEAALGFYSIVKVLAKAGF